MKVILQQDVKGPGQEGPDDRGQRRLRPQFSPAPEAGGARHGGERQHHEDAGEGQKAQEAAEKAEAEATAAKLKELTVKVVAKGGNGGRLFGAVTSKEIADALQAQHGIAIPKTKIVQDEPIKAFGGYELKVKLGYEVTGTLKVVVAEA